MPKISVRTLIEVKSISDQIDNWVEISGDVKRPGLYDYSRVRNINDLINLAGGIYPSYMDSQLCRSKKIRLL